ncbi:sodium/calcium exchanger protein [Saccharothrix algeriensis]|uniref:Cation:H+ antiporter n=1 Tax=Saccharothrix algeriensis TaxID=173560 RepID=A0A8T8I068_9PSEU|nr:sodium:proton exchanger [Saccharothrix algeriensis]MBM7809992.1 cation:H+ antiporter [Saccharothrix algeriensis]QTR04235.1 sodium:proton exchanger [Saccharothrix algeriensis]
MRDKPGSSTSAAVPPRSGVVARLWWAVAVVAPGALLGAADYLGLPHPHLEPPVAAAVFGAAIVGAAFLLSWAAEAAQVDIGAGLAIALLAVLAVLPEYAVDLVFTFQAGQQYAEQGSCGQPGGVNPCSLALANMTGANRILVGVGWPLVVLVASVAAVRARRRSDSARPGRVALAPAMSADVVFLGVATLYSLTLPLRSSLTLVDAAVFVAIFAAYAWRLSKAPAEEPDLAGVSAWVGGKPARARRSLVIGLFAVAGLVILTTAEHFAENLVGTGARLGVDEFLLVQWIAPLASESPELIVACLFAARLKASESLGTLLSSKVNQWTLLVGTIPIVFALSAGTTHGLPLDGHQRLELLITAAQSLFAVAILADLALTSIGAITLVVLFAVQFTASLTLPAEGNRVVIIVLSAVYGALALLQFARHRRDFARTARDGLVTPFAELVRRPPGHHG